MGTLALTCDVVIEELTPLHHHGGKLVSADVAVSMDQCADGAGGRQRAAECRLAEAIDRVAVLGRQKTLERPERSAPLRVFDVVARAVACPVQRTERRAFNVVRSQRTILKEIRVPQRNSTLGAESISLTDSKPEIIHTSNVFSS